MQKFRLICLFLCAILLTGCWDAIHIEQRALVSVVGVDYFEDAPHYLITAIYPLVSPARTGESRVQSVRTHSLAEGFAILNHSNNNIVSFGKLLLTVFGEEAARQGVASIINDLYKHPDIRTNSLVIVARGRAVDLLSVVPPDGQRIGFYLRDMLEWVHFYGDISSMQLFAFTSTMMVHGMDSETTLVGRIGTTDPRPEEQKSGGDAGGNEAGGGEGGQGEDNGQPTPQEDVQLMGAALWYGDKMVGELNLPEVQYLSILQGRPRNMPLQFLLEGEDEFAPVAERLVVYIERSGTSWQVVMVDGQAQYIADLSVRVTLYNYQGTIDLFAMENAEVLQEVLAENIRMNALAALQKASAMGSDPLFLGQQVRLKYPREWDPERWPDMLKQADFTIDCKVTIRQVGYQVTRMEPKNSGK